MRLFNFSAGPAMMPASVLEQARQELLSWQGKGYSILEMPFTGPEFKSILRSARDQLRQLLAVPDNYHILFLHGGASAHFSLVPLNLLGEAEQADYLDSGYWSRRAITEARRYCKVNVAASSQDSNYVRLPEQRQMRFERASAYCHFTSNETADGVQFHTLPESGEIPLVADMTSDFLTRPIDVSKFGLIYASAQKNIGPAGFTVVIVRADLLGRASPLLPTMFNYTLQSQADSLLNTPVTFAIYLAGLIFRWVVEKGGLDSMAKRCALRSAALYRAIDSSNGFYRCSVDPSSRSQVTVCFSLPDESVTEKFFAEARERGLINLRGHKAAGAVRVSLYNAMPDAGVDALLDFMAAFAQEYAAHV